MNHKVLLADDSLTIQKVIKITLANQPYDITDCSNEDELFRELSIVQPKLVFLDFNLSEKFTGYELTTKIKSICPTTKVLLLLGTFDSVDDSAMEKCGASDKIVKPFDSNKFIAICKQLIETFGPNEDIPYPKAKVEPKSVFPDAPEEQWTVSHSTGQKFPETTKLPEKAPEPQNMLAKEMSDWGMSVPGIINDASSHDLKIDLPPVIGEIKSLHDHRIKVESQKFETKFPDQNDLDYPSMDEKPLEMEIQGAYIPDESDVSSIEAQIKDEVEGDLWKVDEFEDLKKEVSAKIEEVKSNFQPTRNDFDESLFKPLDDQDSIDWNDSTDLFKTSTASSESIPQSVDMNDLRPMMEEMVRKYVKEYMDQMFQKNTEKVAWEVIPDLAENIIRQELSKISNKIINE